MSSKNTLEFFLTVVSSFEHFCPIPKYPGSNIASTKSSVKCYGYAVTEYIFSKFLYTFGRKLGENCLKAGATVKERFCPVKPLSCSYLNAFFWNRWRCFTQSFPWIQKCKILDGCVKIIFAYISAFICFQIEWQVWRRSEFCSL